MIYEIEWETFSQVVNNVLYNQNFTDIYFINNL